MMPRNTAFALIGIAVGVVGLAILVGVLIGLYVR